ncbi:MAG: signal recognition particle subunit SRP19/SEC65 family protein [Candidatus Nezhaarchaeota archaeon]|nr:signal recognition particle subunit SRP19/SEC65 family protein [Candidatus Nezhaarchaeota archaeon]
MIYPCYLDSTKTRSGGRKVPKKLAVSSPKIEEIHQAARELGLDPSIEGKAHPSWWWEEPGRVSVKKVMQKSKILLLVAQKVSEKRGRHPHP